MGEILHEWNRGEAYSAERGTPITSNAFKGELPIRLRRIHPWTWAHGDAGDS